MLIVNLFGGPGSGKSTLALLVTGMLKTRHPHLTVECPGEFAKEVVYDGALKALNAQLYISGRQWWRVAQCADHADIVVTDSPIMMSPVYGRRCNPPTPPEFDTVCRFHHDQFPSMNFFVHRIHAYEAKARVHDEEASKLVAAELKAHLLREKIEHENVQSTEAFAGYIADTAAWRAEKLKNNA